MTMANGGLHFGLLLDSGSAQFSISVSHPSGKGKMYLFLTFKQGVYHKKSVCFSKHYDIQKRPQNIIDLRTQTSYGITLIADVLLFDQVKMFILKATHSYLGNETTFGLWLFGFILGILGKKQASY